MESKRYPVVLLVDDDPAYLASVQRQLRREQCMCIAAASGAEALGILSVVKVDVALVDEHMPCMSGSELLQHVKLSYPSVMRVLVTGQPSVSCVSRAINDAGVYKFWAKPFGVQEVFTSLCEALAEQESLDFRKRARKARRVRVKGVQ